MVRGLKALMFQMCIMLKRKTKNLGVHVKDIGNRILYLKEGDVGGVLICYRYIAVAFLNIRQKSYSLLVTRSCLVSYTSASM